MSIRLACCDWSPGPPSKTVSADDVRELTAVIWHGSGGLGDTAAWCTHPDNRDSSWHATIRRGGLGVQHYGLDQRCWHAGGSVLDGRTDANACTIGIEVETYGAVVLHQGRWARADPKGVWRFLAAGREVWRDPVDGTVYEAIDAGQQATLARVVAEIGELCPQLRVRSAHRSHQSIRPDRRMGDPGGHFPWAIIDSQLSARWPHAA